MTPEELTAKVEELRAAIAEKLAELEENRKWAVGADEREELVQALEELAVQATALSEALHEDHLVEESNED